MRVTIFSTGGKICPVSIFTYLHALTLVARSYAVLTQYTPHIHGTCIHFLRFILQVVRESEFCTTRNGKSKLSCYHLSSTACEVFQFVSHFPISRFTDASHVSRSRRFSCDAGQRSQARSNHMHSQGTGPLRT